MATENWLDDEGDHEFNSETGIESIFDPFTGELVAEINHFDESESEEDEDDDNTWNPKKEKPFKEDQPDGVHDPEGRITDPDLAQDMAESEDATLDASEIAAQAEGAEVAADAAEIAEAGSAATEGLEAAAVLEAAAAPEEVAAGGGCLAFLFGTPPLLI